MSNENLSTSNHQETSTVNSIDIDNIFSNDDFEKNIKVLKNKTLKLNTQISDSKIFIPIDSTKPFLEGYSSLSIL